MPAATDSAMDVAMWFVDQALNDNEYLQPQKLHRLLFLAQAYFAVAFAGRKLMPAVFVADEVGPLEPNVYRALSKGRPELDADLFMPHEVENFLANIWRRFGHHSAEHLTKLCKETMAYRQAFARSKRAEITHDAMRLSFTRAQGSPAVETVIKPKIMRSQNGKTVTVKSWVPGTKPAGKE